MITHNKNKIAKELTLEEIIQKTAYRKNIDTVSLIQNKLNNKQYHATSMANTHIKKRFQELQDLQFHLSKNLSEKGDKIQKKNISTGRIINSSKQIYTNSNTNQLFLPMNSKNNVDKQDQMNKNFKKSYRNQTILLEKKMSEQNKRKKRSDYLCVNGVSGNILKKPLTADKGCDCIPHYEMKKYQTFIELGCDFRKRQKSMNFASIGNQQKQTKSYKSFILGKYKTQNKSGKKLSKSIEGENIPQNNQKKNTISPQQLAKAKAFYCGVKTQQENKTIINQQGNQIQIENLQTINNQTFEDKFQQNSKKGIQNRGPFSSRSIAKNKLTQVINQIETDRKQKNSLSRKNNNQEAINRKEVKLYPPQKRAITCQKIKSKYFIPDFIKPSLDFVIFERKIVEVIKNQQKETKVLEKQKKDQVLQNNLDTDTEAQCIKGKSLSLNVHSDYYKVKQLIEIKDQNLSNQNSLFQENKKLESDENVQKNQKSRRRIKIKNFIKQMKPSLVSLTNGMQHAKICGWEDSQKSNKKAKSRILLNSNTEIFQF